jgi:uncharacterized protein (DUF1499 family)
MLGQILKSAFLLLALIGLVYTILAATMGRARILELCFGPAPVEAVDFGNLVLKETPNQYLVCPPEFRAANAHAESPVFDEPVQSLKEKWFALLERQPRTELVHSDPENERYTFRVKTAVIHFPDDVTVQFIALGGKRSTLAIYSRSHYGHSDLGENRRRIESWLRQLAAAAPG